MFGSIADLLNSARKKVVREKNRATSSITHRRNMSIIRIKHNRENPYVQINKKALWDPDLSLQAVGLWARLMSRPDDWQINTKELSRNCNSGIDRIRNIIKELCEAGYAYTEQKTNELGQFTGYDYTIFEFKMNEEEIQKMFPNRQNPVTEDPFTENAPPTNKRKELNNESTNPLNPPKGGNAQARVPREENVSTTEEEHKRLINDFGEAVTSAAYKHLSEWKIDVPKTRWRKSDNLAIRRWVIDALKKKGIKKDNTYEQPKGKGIR